MSAGIYMYNGVINKSLNLEKKLKRRQGAVILEEYKGDLTEPKDLEHILQAMLDKHNKITKSEEKTTEDKPLKYHWRNKITGATHHSIYPHMNNIPNLNKDEWEPYEEN